VEGLEVEGSNDEWGRGGREKRISVMRGYRLGARR
jgi:hypothetical protein